MLIYIWVAKRIHIRMLGEREQQQITHTERAQNKRKRNQWYLKHFWMCLCQHTQHRAHFIATDKSQSSGPSLAIAAVNKSKSAK